MTLDNPAMLAKELKAATLDTWPRSKVLDLFKTVDGRLDMIGYCGTADDHKAWMEPWTVLIDYIDPRGLVEFPLNDWTQVEELLKGDKPGQAELFA